MHRGNLPRTSGLKSYNFPLLVGLHELEIPVSRSRSNDRDRE